jgi:choline dehydrogenase-like flavoprotein
MSVALWDYIVVGGGLGGSVVSSRLLEYQPEAKILIVEAGPNVNDNQDILYPNGTIPGELTWRVPTTPQERLNDRSVNIAIGHALGGGTAINGGMNMQLKSQR